jgi:MGT family glycosyltransferase
VVARPEGRRLGAAPDWIAALPRPLVFVSFGTVNASPPLFETVIEGLRDRAGSVLLAVSRSVDPDGFAPLPENIHVRQYVPQEFVFPHCDAFVTTASFQTAVLAINHGVPLAMVPLSGDEAMCADRFFELGAGLVLQHPAAPRCSAAEGPFDASTLRKTVERLLCEAAWHDRAAALARAMTAAPSIAARVGALEALATGAQETIPDA